MVVSASKDRSLKFSRMVLDCLSNFPAVLSLVPKDARRRSVLSFDVGPAGIAQAPSMFSLGINGQITGNRADIIIADDIETSTNSLTQASRDTISEGVKEFGSVVKPVDEGGRVIFLGTPQHEASLYNTLRKDREYICRIWPARYPSAEQIEAYEGCLAPLIQRRLSLDPSLIGRPTDPKRFHDLELRRREAELGRSTFTLQFMLDTSLSDSERYPLKISDLLVMPLSTELSPMQLGWTTDPNYIVDGIPSVGFSGDVWRKPYGVSNVEYIPYEGAVLAVDPSGRGGDETAYVVVKLCNGRLFLIASGGIKGGYDDETLKTLAKVAKLHKVNLVLVESNFGDGMFTKVFTPILTKVYPCTIEEVRNNTQKEKRIIDTLEPVLNQHRLVVSEDVAIQDYKGSKRHENQLFFQMTRLTKDKGCLSHDDRIDVLAMAVAYWVDHMSRDVDKAYEDSMEDRLRQEFEFWEVDVLGSNRQQQTSFGLGLV